MLNKKSVLYILLDAIFLIVFNTVFFVLGGTNHPASVWMSYGFIHFSYVMVLITPFLIRKSSSAAVFGFSLYSISATYFIVEFIAGLIFILLRSETIKIALTVQIIIAGIYCVILISNLIANEHTADAVERKEDEVAFIKISSSRIKMLIGQTNDKKASKAIEQAYDLLHSSPTKSTNAVRDIEETVIQKISLLEVAVKAKNNSTIIALSGEIVELMSERNRKIRLNQ